MAQLTLQQAFELALQHQRNGRLKEAEDLCRQILAQQPANAAAMHLCGVVALQSGRADVAEDLIRGAIALRPDFPEAHGNLGGILRDAGKLEEAIAECRRAIALRPGYGRARNNLGNALKDKGELPEAVAAYRQAIAAEPDLAEAHNNLGNALKEMGELPEAIAECRRAIVLRPGFAGAYSNLGDALRGAGEIDEAIAMCGKAVALSPRDARAHNNLGNALQDGGNLEEAIAAYRRAIELNPALPEAHSNLGSALKEKGDIDGAISACRKAIELKPDYAGAHSNLGNALQAKGELVSAAAAYRQAIACHPTFAGAYGNLANALREQGRLDDAIAAYRQAIALDPAFVDAHSNLLFTLQYHGGYHAPEVAEEHRQWNRRHGEALAKFARPHENDRDPSRRLRVGYVSADFKDHAVSRFLLPLFGNHDRAAYEIICYSDVVKEDATTEQLRRCADEWHKIVGMTDTRAADQVRKDKIDILVDLAGHTANNRLRVFARKPAPVQVAYLGYPATTGLTAIDYRLTDALTDPPGMTESLHTEKLWRLPGCNWCYGEPEDGPEVQLVRAGGPICFGSFNNFAKASDVALDLWAAILRAVPESRIMIKYGGLGDPTVRERIGRLFESRGVLVDRLEIRGSAPNVRAHLELYNQMDIALDSFPYHGTTTTCEALWMGVPVVTLAGDSHVSRVGVSLLSNVGLGELIAQSREEYVEIAVTLARDAARLAELRRTLRQRMRASPLMEAGRFARDVEEAYRAMWRNWCEAAEQPAEKNC